jgi:hypothetical protein
MRYAELEMVITWGRTKLKVVFLNSTLFSGATYWNSELKQCKFMRLYLASVVTLLDSCNRDLLGLNYTACN